MESSSKRDREDLNDDDDDGVVVLECNVVDIDESKPSSQPSSSKFRNADEVQVSATSLYSFFQAGKEPNNITYSCNNCSWSARGGSRMKIHAREKHPKLLEHVEAFGRTSKRQRIEISMVQPKAQSSLDQFFINATHYDALHLHIARFLVAKCLPMNFISDVEFKHFIDSLLSLGRSDANINSHVLMERRPFSSKIVPKFCKDIADTIANGAVIEARHYGATLASDGRSNVRNDPIIVFAIETRNNFLLLGSINAGSSKKDSKYLYEELKKCITNHDFNYGCGADIIGNVTDNAPSCIKAGYRLENLDSVLLVRCQAHAISVCMKHLVRKVKIISEAADMCEEIVTFVRSRPRVSALLKKYSKGKSLFRFVDTRFAFHLISMRRLQKLLGALNNTFLSKEYEDYINEESKEVRDRSEKICTYLSSAKFSKGLDFTISVLTPLLQFLRYVDSSRNMNPYIFMGWKCLADHVAKQMNQPVFSDIDERISVVRTIAEDWDKFHCPVFSVGLLLNPFLHQQVKEISRSRHPDSVTQYQELMLDLNFVLSVIVKRLNPGFDNTMLGEISESLKLDFANYLGAEVKIKKETCPISFWQTWSGGLRLYAPHLLCISVCVSNVERTHKLTSLIHSSSRNRTTLSMVDHLTKGNLGLRNIRYSEETGSKPKSRSITSEDEILNFIGCIDDASEEELNHCSTLDSLGTLQINERISDSNHGGIVDGISMPDDDDDDAYRKSQQNIQEYEEVTEETELDEQPARRSTRPSKLSKRLWECMEMFGGV